MQLKANTDFPFSAPTELSQAIQMHHTQNNMAWVAGVLGLSV